MQMQIDLSNLKDFLCEYLPAMDEQKIPTTINRGGCGYFAYELATVLQQMNVPYKIIVGFSNQNEHFYRTQTIAKEGVNETTKQLIKTLCVDHIMVSVKGTLIDAMGDCDEAYLFSERIEVTLDQLKAILGTRNWNEDFDKKQLPKIREYLQAIPTAFENWQGKGQYKYVNKREIGYKKLNTHTARSLSNKMFWW